MKWINVLLPALIGLFCISIVCFFKNVSCNISDEEHLIRKYDKKHTNQIFVSYIERDLDKIITLLKEINNKLPDKQN